MTFYLRKNYECSRMLQHHPCHKKSTSKCSEFLITWSVSSSRLGNKHSKIWQTVFSPLTVLFVLELPRYPTQVETLMLSGSFSPLNLGSVNEG